jgi:hypothetical protein
MSLKTEIRDTNEEIKYLFTKLSKSVAAAEFWKKKCLTDSKVKYEAALTNIKYEYDENTAPISPGRQQLIQEMNYLAREWDDVAWNNWSINHAYTKPEAVRFGQSTVAGHVETQTFPALLPLVVNGRWRS